jgi:hypothetical protein
MNRMRCHACRSWMAASFVVCPHCGAVQDDQGRAESMTNRRELLIILAPALLFMAIAVWRFESAWAVVLACAAGIAVGLVTVAAKYARLLPATTAEPHGAPGSGRDAR